MLGLRYDTPAARAMARRISEVMRDAVYGASVELAKERAPSAVQRRPVPEPRQLRVTACRPT